MRRDRNLLNSSGSYSLRYNLPYSFLKLINRRSAMKELSSGAKTRLAFLEFYAQVKDVTLTCKIFKISRQTFYKWKRRYDPKNLLSLENQSKAPKRRREGKLSFKEEIELKRFRERHLRIGKVKLSLMYEREYGKRYSPWQFQKVIHKYNLYYDRVKAEKIRSKRDKRRGAKKIRINEINPQRLY